MPKIACIIQARLTSTRLPGKILMPLDNKPALEHVLARCKKVRAVTHIAVATLTGTAHDPLDALCAAHDVFCLRGPEEDVLARYALTARALQPDWVIRITADCPLIDPLFLEKLIAETLEKNADYAHSGQCHHGMAAEMFKTDILYRAEQEATQKDEREHVTLWMLHHPHLKRHFCPMDPPVKDENRLRLVLDYPEDYQLLSEIARLAPKAFQLLTTADIEAIFTAHPALKDINHDVGKIWDEKQKNLMQRHAQKQ